MKVFLGKQSVIALIDPGSVRSYVNEETARICQKNKWRQETSQRIAVLADGTETTLKNSLTGQIRTINKKFTHQFLIMKNLSHNMLLGMDALRKLKIKISLNGQIIESTIEQTDMCSIEIQDGLAHLTISEREQLEILLKNEMKNFKGTQGVTPLIQHKICLENITPIKQRYRPRNPAMQEIINQEIERMLKEKVIRPSKSPWSSPIVVVQKKDGKPRLCVDYRKLNTVTCKDAYPLPQINATLDKLRGAKYLSTIDLKNGYWQKPLTSESKPLTAFTVAGKGLFEFNVMPFGLHSAPATFQRLLDYVISPELSPNAFAYLDDIVIVSKTFPIIFVY